jgi:hypothetical protein
MLAAPLAARIQPTGEEALASSPAKTPTKVPVIDCHNNVGVTRLPGTSNDLTDLWFTFEDPDGVLGRMEEAGIDHSVIAHAGALDSEKGNEEIAELCRRHPGKFIGFAKYSSQRDKGRIRSLMFRDVHELGLRGVGQISEPPSRELLDAISELGIPLLYHAEQFVGRDYSENVELFQDFVADYPNVNFIVSHLGSDNSCDWRQHIAGIELAKTYPNVYIDTSSVVITSYLEKATQELPAEKIIFGSDGESCDSRMEIYKIRVLKLPKEKEELILGGNILRLMGGRL